MGGYEKDRKFQIVYKYAMTSETTTTQSYLKVFKRRLHNAVCENLLPQIEFLVQKESRGSFF